MIDITITATIRPILLKRTLTSFFKNCFNDFSIRNKLKNKIHIIINVDPIGENRYSQKHMYDICKRFSDNVTYNAPKKPNFAKAVIWCWKQCKNKYVFHLEDDWILNDRINLENLISMIQNRDVAAVRLYKRDYPKKPPYMMFDCEYTYENNLFIATDSSNQFGLNPVLIDRKFIDTALILMTGDLNPEKQFRVSNKKMKQFVLAHKYAIYGKPGMKALVSDIGLSWRKQRNIEKPKGATFINWKVK